MFRICGFILAAALVAFADEIPNPVIRKGDATTELDRILLRGLHDVSGSENIFYSPICIRAALNVLLLAAEGDTANDLSFFLGFENRTKWTIAKQMRKFLVEDSRVAATGGTTLRQSVGIFVDTKYTLNTVLRKTLRTYHDADVQNVQFSDNSNTADTINRWLAERTENKINDLVSPQGFDPSMAAMVVSAIYLKAAWKKKFMALPTQREFFNSDSDKVITDFIYGISEDFGVYYYEDLNATAVQIPFNDSSLSMLILLPKNRDGIRTLERQLENLDLNSIARNLKTGVYDVVMPKFQITGKANIENILSKYKEHMFSTSADFRYLLEPIKPIQIKDIKHAANINVDEYGIEAAAATSVVALERGGPKMLIIIDHPFLFFIRNERMNFFAGRVGSLKKNPPPTSPTTPITPTSPRFSTVHHKTTEELFIVAD